jgi:hypothetical protein
MQLLVELSADRLSPDGARALNALYRVRNLSRFGVEDIGYDGPALSEEEIEKRGTAYLEEFASILEETPAMGKAVSLFFLGVLEFTEEILLGYSTLAAQNILGEDVGMIVSREKRERALFGMSLLLSKQEEMPGLMDKLRSVVAQLEKQ